ncbi:hypothetical protein AB1N83_003609 [Pleurotus pulmonarius]
MIMGVKLGNAILVALHSKSDRELNSRSQIRSCPFSLHVRPSEKSYLSQHVAPPPTAVRLDLTPFDPH